MNNEKEDQGADTTGKDRPHHNREKTEMDRARSKNGRQQTAMTSCTLGYMRYKEIAWKKATEELDRHRTTRFEKHRHDLGSSASLSTEKAGVGVWPDMSSIWDELRTKVRNGLLFQQSTRSTTVHHIDKRLMQQLFRSDCNYLISK